MSTPMTDDTRLVAELSRRRIAELVQEQPVWTQAVQSLSAQVGVPESILGLVFTRLRERAPMTVEDILTAPLQPHEFEVLGRSVYIALAVAWTHQAGTVAERPF
jgi:hypothetical protein